jgi:hypothetical protein
LSELERLAQEGRGRAKLAHVAYAARRAGDKIRQRMR